MKLLRMTPGHGDVLLAEGDPELAEDEERLVAEFRRQLDLGMWAAVPLEGTAGRHEATMVRDFSEVPTGAEQVIFFPKAAGGRATAATEDAERRALELLRSVAGEEAYRMYTELGFLALEGGGEGYGYLIYPQRPVVAYDSDSGELLSEYCILFRDDSERLPDADDVLAKWIGLRADERALIGTANLDPPGRQLDPDMVRRDLVALAAWTGYPRMERHRKGIPGGEAEEMPFLREAT
jgi:hypothetical protein